MPDDLPDHARARGAEPATIHARLEGTSLRRHAVWRQPEAHPAAPRIDRLYAQRELTPRQYQNACAMAELCWAAGLFRSKGVAEWMRLQMGRSHSTEPTPEDELRQIIRDGGVDVQAVLMLLDPSEPVVRQYMWSRALRGLSRLDHVAARWDGQRWGEE